MRKKREGVWKGKKEEKNPPLLRSNWSFSLCWPSAPSGRGEGGRGEGFGQKKPRSLILIKKHWEHQRPTQNLYHSGAPTIATILKLGRHSVSSSEAGARARVTQGLGDFKVLKVSGKFALTPPHLRDWLLLNKLSAGRGKKKVGDDDNWQLWADNSN